MKSGDNGEEERCIGGLATTDSTDLQGQSVLQDGLDFSYFEKNGWFTDEHSKDPKDIVGWSTSPALFVRKGQTLPDGRVAPADGHWVEGKLTKSKKADAIWDSMRGLEKAGAPRGLGLSLDGDVQQTTADKRKITKALVRWIAITAKPVNPETSLSALVKSLQAVDEHGIDAISLALHKALTSGVGPAQPCAQVAGDGSPIGMEDTGRRKKKKQRSRMRRTDLVEALSNRMPDASMTDLGKLTDIIFSESKK